MAKINNDIKNSLWRQLLNENVLKKGYHLAKKDAKSNFISNTPEIEAFAADLSARIKEIINRLKQESAQPSPIVNIDVPKTSLTIRAGCLITFEDSVILNAIIYIIAPLIDKELQESVYSYRVKEDYKKGKLLFKESKIADIPYLKSKTVSKRIDIFDPWYANWPEFDKESRAAFERDGYGFMAVTDISAYFDNIHLYILRDILFRFLPNEQHILNLLLEFLECWVCKTHHGRTEDRGIPQGNQVSSFLGNIFLHDLDNDFADFCKEKDARYFRYVDDIRIFTKSEEDARLAILKMDKTLRKLHLNIQSSKTQILRERPNKEISKFLLDDRLDAMNALFEDKGRDSKIICKEAKSLVSKPSKYGIAAIISKKRKIVLKDANSRLFRRWAHLCIIHGCPDYINRLEFEIRNNPETRVTKMALRTFQSFPRRKAFAMTVFNFITSSINVFPHQEAELIRGMRYLYVIPKEIIDHCKKNVFSTDNKIDFHVKMESLKLLIRVGLTPTDITFLEKSFDSEEAGLFKRVLSSAIMCDFNNQQQKMRRFIFYPNKDVKETAKYMWQLKYDKIEAMAKLNYIFAKNVKDKGEILHHRIIDNIPELFLLANSSDNNIRASLKNILAKVNFLYSGYTVSDVLLKVLNGIKPIQK